MARRFELFRMCVLGAFAGSVSTPAANAEDKPPEAPQNVSYYTQIRPIFQANCHGCHQPAKAKGKYVMTAFDRLLVGGGDEPAIVPGKPDESGLIKMITPVDGKAEMPDDGDPLAETEIELIRKWIAQGAVNDTPKSAETLYDMDHPPVYTRAPVMTSMDYSPDGSWLAVTGFHEVLLVKADGSELVARLVGLSERIESVRFSPDGKRLAVTGGLPARMGEVQIWDLAGEKPRLALSVPITYDTVYGASWSPDGKLLALGCSDHAVRAIEADTGKPVLYQGAHNDWVLDTIFSADGSHLASVGRDMSAKLTEVATERFVDNITSITPGALKGGIQTVARHPERDEIVIGGSDGVVKVYRMHRLTKRVIGDDANMIRRMPPMTGRIFSVAVSRDGKRIAAGSSLDGAGQVHVYAYEFDTGLPDNIKEISEKVAGSRSAEENKTLETFHTDGVKLIAETWVPESAIYAVAFAPDGKTVAAAGADGSVRLINATDGTVSAAFSPAPLVEKNAPTLADRRAPAPAPQDQPKAESLPDGETITALEVHPDAIELKNRFEYVQLLVTGRLASGDEVDVTRLVDVALSAKIVDVSPRGVIRPTADGEASLRLSLAGQTTDVRVQVTGMNADFRADYIRHVTPVMSRMGCSSGLCHGSDKGKNGFKLSLRGYDPILDVRALTDDHASRRVNVASPDNSLMLLKASSTVPHEGGQVTRPGEPYYDIIHNWITNGAILDTESPRVSRIDVRPANPIVQRIGGQRQVRVVATYADGMERDVTLEAFIESGDTEVAAAGEKGLVTAIRRGETPILARYEGAYAATMLTVMGDRTGFVWSDPPVNNRIDELVAAKWKRMKILPSELSTDEEFIRRAYLDLTGLPPTLDQLQAFMTDPRDARIKRDELVDSLLTTPAYVDHWTNKWADLLQVNRKFLGAEGGAVFRDWIRGEVADSTPYDLMVKKLLTASGSNRENPAASYYKILRDPAETMENTTHLFLGVRFNCNKCHDHPFEKWTQDQYYQTAAYFARVGLKADPASKDQRIGGTAVEGAKPLYEIVYERDKGEVVHIRTSKDTPPKFPFEAKYEVPENATRRDHLAAWITSPDNPYFTRSFVNRLWGYLFGIGLMEPIDDIRAGNPPTNPELLAYLADEFQRSGFDVRSVLRLICTSRTYQLSFRPNKWNIDDKLNYSHAIPRRLSAEVLHDAAYLVTGAVSHIPGVEPGTRAAALPDSGIGLPGRFLATLGRPARESACECERSNDLHLGSVMALVSGPTIGQAIADESNAIAQLVAQESDDSQVISALFQRILNRPATSGETQAALAVNDEIDADHNKLVKSVQEREPVAAQLQIERADAREKAIATAKADLAAYEIQIAPDIAKKEMEKEETTKKLAGELKVYEDKLDEKLAQWETKQSLSVEWIPLSPHTLEAGKGVKLVRLPDRSVFAQGETPNSAYTFVAETNLRNITAIRLEVIADERLPKGGPGRAADGNFVLTELELQAAPKADPKKAEKITLKNAMADFSQGNFDVAAAVDGDANNAGNGWAVSPSFGTTHWATFDAAAPIDHEAGTVLRFTLHHNFNGKDFLLGRFRLSVTTATTPPGLSLSEELAAILATAPDHRDDPQKNILMTYYRRVDKELQRRENALADSKKPLPIDTGLKQRQDRLAHVSKPVPPDAVLVQLQKDLEESTKQFNNKRLTAAQDLAWALINSPAFLFNH
jgi:WD40 repeat protein